MKIPFLKFAPIHSSIREEMVRVFEDVYESNWFIMGKYLQEFEKVYAQFNQTKFAIGISNGLDALSLSLRAVGVGPGDEVILPAHTFFATSLAVSHVGATPIFVEPRMETFNINPDLIEKVITRKTKAIIPVHLYGQACEMDLIEAIANSFKLSIVEDNAQAHGSSWNGKLTGSIGKCNGVSFYPGKNLGALGDGGAITTDDEIVAEKVRMLRNYGSKEKYHHEMVGYNMRLDELQAAFLSVKLKYLESWTTERQRLAVLYNKGFADIPEVITPQKAEKADHVYHLYVIRVSDRDSLQQYLKANGISTLIHYPIPLHLQKAYSGLKYRVGDFPVTEEIARTVLSLPLWPGMSEANVKAVVNAIRDFYK